MTDREKLLELLNKKYDHYCDQCGVNKDSHYTENLAEYLVAHGVRVQGWIPVTERFPDVNKTKSGYESITVIATDGKSVRPMKYERACVRTKSVQRWRWVWDKIYDGSPITHWMPLPQPPKAE